MTIFAFRSTGSAFPYERRDLQGAKLPDPTTREAGPGGQPRVIWPQIAKMLSPALRLRTDQDATVLQHALDVSYPNVSEDEKKAATFHHAGNQWQFVRNHFFGAPTGFIFTTDRTGAITSVKYMLKMP